MPKLSYEDKINIYNDKKQGMSLTSLSKKYKVRMCVIQYIIPLVDKHGIDILKRTKNKKYSPYEKEQMINRVLNNNESIRFVSIDEGLSTDKMLREWIKKYKENGYNIVERKRGRPTMDKINKKKETKDEKNQKT